MILVLYFESLFGTEAGNFNFCSGLFTGYFFNRFLNRHIDARGSNFEVFPRSALQKSTFHRNRCLWNSASIFDAFGGLGTSFSDFRALETSLENVRLLVT